MSDLISRQAAIEHLKKRLYETALNNDTEHPYYEEMADNRVSVWLEELPRVDVPDHGDLIDRDKFVVEKREQFCADCIKRKSLKTGRFVYEIGDCVCRACDIDDMLNYIEDAPVVIPAERSEKANGEH